MNARIFAFLIALLPVAATGQGFAGLGEVSEGYALPERGQPIRFPQDHGAHPDFRIEWWYLTATLTGDDGRDYGLQWTLFRTALAPTDATDPGPQVWMGHAAVTTPERHFVTERLARGDIGQAGVTADPFSAWIDEWALEGADFDDLTARAYGPDFGYEIALSATGPIVRHGDDGYSVKSPEGTASYYYSQPFFAVDGTLFLADGPVEVTGSGWIDREWSSAPLSQEQEGWDWFSLSFEEGSKLMGFRVRAADGGAFTTATWIAADGSVTPYGDGAFSAEPLEIAELAQADVPVRWRVRLPEEGVDVVVDALNPEAWMETLVPYWEGPVTVTGSATGRGYLEMTGYE